MRLREATAAEARRQAAWIVRERPWQDLGYRQAPLGRWLAQQARAGRVRVAVVDAQVVAVIVTQPDVLLGHFIALLAVAPAAAGQGIGRALVEEAAARAGRTRRWLYTSSDAGNRAAAAFYRKLGFRRVGRLPDLVKPGRDELLWRRPATA
jgi:ribosomal-protein-alanine N-acetyltransferase